MLQWLPDGVAAGVAAASPTPVDSTTLQHPLMLSMLTSTACGCVLVCIAGQGEHQVCLQDAGQVLSVECGVQLIDGFKHCQGYSVAASLRGLVVGTVAALSCVPARVLVVRKAALLVPEFCICHDLQMGLRRLFCPISSVNFEQQS